jgi:hypothetical protein
VVFPAAVHFLRPSRGSELRPTPQNHHCRILQHRTELVGLPHWVISATPHYLASIVVLFSRFTLLHLSRLHQFSRLLDSCSAHSCRSSPPRRKQVKFRTQAFLQALSYKILHFSASNLVFAYTTFPCSALCTPPAVLHLDQTGASFPHWFCRTAVPQI